MTTELLLLSCHYKVKLGTISRQGLSVLIDKCHITGETQLPCSSMLSLFEEFTDLKYNMSSFLGESIYIRLLAFFGAIFPLFKIVSNNMILGCPPPLKFWSHLPGATQMSPHQIEDEVKSCLCVRPHPSSHRR